MLMDMEAAQDAETIAKLKKEKHDLKFEIRQLRERVDKLEQEDIAHRKLHGMMQATSIMEMRVINDLHDLVTKLSDDVDELKKKVNELEDKDGYFDDCIANICHRLPKPNKKEKK